MGRSDRPPSMGHWIKQTFSDRHEDYPLPCPPPGRGCVATPTRNFPSSASVSITCSNKAGSLWSWQGFLEGPVPGDSLRLISGREITPWRHSCVYALVALSRRIVGNRSSTPADHNIPPHATDAEDGKICYIEIPALEVRRSSSFMRKSFDGASHAAAMARSHLMIATGQVSGPGS